MKLFNNHLYVILSIKQKEKLELVEIAKSHNLDIEYPELFFEEKGDLSRICIDDESLGGYLMTLVCSNEISLLKNKKYRTFKNIKELKGYLNIVDKRKEQYFVLENDINRYLRYVDSLSFEELKDEYYLINNLMDYIDIYYLKIKQYIEKTFTNLIKNDIARKENSIEVVYKHLDKIVKLRDEIDDFLNINIYLINKDNNSDLNASNSGMKSYLKRIHYYFHESEQSGYFYLKVIMQNLDTIFNIFNFKLKAEGKVSYKHEVFKQVKKLGYQEYLPNYLVGDKKNKKWDYLSVLDRLLYTLKIYDCYPLLSNDLIPLAFKTREEVEVLSNKLVSIGYKDKDDLIHCTKHKYPPVAVMIEIKNKTFRAGGGITIMACMCSSRKRKPLYISDLLNHFEKIIIHHDFVYHNLLLIDITKDKSRFTPQILSLKEAKKLKDNSKLQVLIDMVKKAK